MFLVVMQEDQIILIFKSMIIFLSFAANHAYGQQVQPGFGPQDSGLRQRH